MKISEALKGKPRPTLAALVKFFESLPKGHVYSSMEIESKRPPGSFSNFRRFPEFQCFRVIDGGQMKWGCSKAIAAYRAGMAKRDKGRA